MNISFELTRDLLLVSPLLILFVASIIPISMKAFVGENAVQPISILFTGLVGLVAAAGLTVSVVNSYWSFSSTNFVEAFHGTLLVDGIAIWSNYIIYIIVGLSLMLTYDHAATRGKHYSEHIFLILNATIGMSLAVMSNNLLIAFIAIELMSLSIYLLIALSNEKLYAKESSFKYLILGGISSAILLYGMAFIFGSSGTLSIPVIGELSANLFKTSSLFVLGTGLMLVGLSFKVSLVPFHSWTPDVYQGAASPVTSFMASAVKFASFIVFLRVFLYTDLIQVAEYKILDVFQWLAALTIIVGNVAAIMQKNLKRLLAYSSIANSGYIFIGLICGVFGTNPDSGVSALLFYLFGYSLMTVGSFALVALFERADNPIVLVEDLKGVAKENPLIAASLSLLMLSLAGLPPLLGFFSKFYLFASAIEQGFYWITFVGIIGSVISVYYYLRPIMYMYMSEAEGEVQINHGAFFSTAVLFLTAIMCVLIGLFSSPIFRYIQRAVDASL